MSDNTKIEWADATVNAVNGCSILSPGCTNCYAMRLAGTRMKHHPTREGLTQDSKAGPVWTGEVRLHEPALLQPLAWKRPRRIFWNAHGDLFHIAVPNEWIDKVLAICAFTPQHTHMILTKRSDRMREYFSDPEAADRVYDLVCNWAIQGLGQVVLIAPKFPAELAPDGRHVPLGVWPLPNVWLGVSVEDQTRADERVPDLLRTPAAVRWLSCEPLLGPVDLTNITGAEKSREYGSPVHGWSAIWKNNGIGRNWLDWVIAGGESGPGARPMHPNWARSLRDQCQAAGVAFHFKQWGDWAPVCEMSEDVLDRIYYPAPASRPDASRRCKVTQCVLHASGQRFDGEAKLRRPAFDQGSRSMTMFEIGKKAAGRLLDGRTWDEAPHA